LRAAYEKRWASPRGFNPDTDRVALRTDAPAAVPQPEQRRAVRILLPLGDEGEWKIARPLLVELAAEFRLAIRSKSLSASTARSACKRRWPNCAKS